MPKKLRKMLDDLKKMGFKFVGSTIIYLFMQTVGLVNDPLKSCSVYQGCVKCEY